MAMAMSLWLRERLQELAQRTLEGNLRDPDLGDLDGLLRLVQRNGDLRSQPSHACGPDVDAGAARRRGRLQTSCPALLGSVVLLRILSERGEKSYGRSQNGFGGLYTA